MESIDTIYNNRKVIREKLIPFGFVQQDSAYSYVKTLMDGQFVLTVLISADGLVSTEVTDARTSEPYVLHKLGYAQGAFVGQIREEYTSALQIINEACFETCIFKSPAAAAVIEYVRQKYGDELEYLWKRFPDNAILRRKDTAKWYAAMLPVQRKKLGLQGDGKTEIIDLRILPEHLTTLLDGTRYFPGYHMNKTHWYTMCLDGSVPEKELFQRLDESYQLA